MAAFYFTGLHAGRYVLSALLSGENVFYGERTGPYVNTVKVGLGTEQKDVIFLVAPHPSVSGTVMDQFGEPFIGAQVGIYLGEWRAQQEGAK